jgi:Transposase-associated domain
MDHNTWMYKIKRNTIEYLRGIDEFLECASEDMKNRGARTLVCPCEDCQILWRFGNIKQVRDHLIHRGFMDRYTRWVRHGENIETFDNINPYFCTETQVQSDIEHTVNYLGQCFVKCENPNSYMFLPYIEKLELQNLINLLIYLLLNLSILIRINCRGHWILLILRLKPSFVYVVDSLNREDETYIIQPALNT